MNSKTLIVAAAGLALLSTVRPAAAQYHYHHDAYRDHWRHEHRIYRYGNGVPNGYYQPYPSTVYPSASPYGGYLSGAANLVNAQGQYLINTQQANLLKEQLRLAQIDVRRQAFDESLYEQANTPTLNDIRIQEQQQEVIRALNNPPQTEIWSGKSLNDLLANAQQMMARGVVGPEVPLNSQMLKDINVSVNLQGNAGALKTVTRPKWPAALRKLYPQEQTTPLRSQIDKLLAQARQQALKGQVDAEVADQLEQSIGRLTDLLKDQVGNTAFADYTAAKRYLKDLDQSVAVLKQPDAGKYAGGAYAAHGSTVNALVSYMSENGLKFAPAVSGEEGAYGGLYQAFLRYTLGNNAMSSMAQPSELP
jgi:hypothetical protein